MSFSRALKKTDHLVRRWFEEPIGVAVPFFAFLAVWLPPQMPDMFAGMEAPIWKMQISARPFLFAFSAMLLGLSAWFWTRAALTAQRDHGETDKVRIQRRHQATIAAPPSDEPPAGHTHHDHTHDYVNWSYEWAPRIALLAAGGITLLPILFSMASGRIMLGLIGMELLSFGLVGLLFAFVVKRTKFRWMKAFGAPTWMLQFRSTRILACAPFGWPFAVLSLACSLAALLVLLARPNWVAAIDAPTTAIASLAFAVGPLVIALAFFRGLVEQSIYLIRWFSHRGEPRQFLPGEKHRVQRLSNLFGGFVMLIWFLSPPWVLEKHRVPLTEARVIEPAGPGDCQDDGPSSATACRPTLKTALQEWVQSRRRGGAAESQRLPLVIIAAEGGASRAAVWLLSSMRMLDTQTQGQFGRHLFAISGVSGGSLGAASYVRMLKAKGNAEGALDWENPETRHALSTIATSDLLSATISTYFLGDMIGSLVGPAWTYAGVPDRNAALETTFDLLWASSSGFRVADERYTGFLSMRGRDADSALPSLPHLMLNGTDVTSGKRLITSSIRINADTALFPDSGDFVRLVSRDIEMATAVTNSARFPFVSPAGRFLSPTEERDYQVIDGGYFENYGARTAWELARAIEDITAADPSINVVPVIVVVSNDLEADQAPRSKGGRCRKQLADLNEDGSQVTIRCDEPPANQTCIEVVQAGYGSGTSQHDQSIVPQSIAPILGLAATRSAHGRDALHIVKRDFCRAQSNLPGEPRTRMIHIALPKPDRDEGQAAPMNWVLNPESCHYMLNVAPWIEFNLSQAHKLNSTLSAVVGVPVGEDITKRPANIDCGG